MLNIKKYIINNAKVIKLVLEFSLLIFILVKLSAMTYFESDYDKKIVQVLLNNHLVMYEKIHNEILHSSDNNKAIQYLDYAARDIKIILGVEKFKCIKINKDGSQDEITISAVTKDPRFQSSVDLKKIEGKTTDPTFKCIEAKMNKGLLDNVVEEAATSYMLEILIGIWSLLIFIVTYISNDSPVENFDKQKKIVINKKRK